MMTREEIAAIDRECEEQHISQQEYLEKHGIARHQYYRWKRRYREEDAQCLVWMSHVVRRMLTFKAVLVGIKKNSSNRP